MKPAKIALSDVDEADAASRALNSYYVVTVIFAYILVLMKQNLLHRKLESASFEAESASSTSESAS